MAILKAALFLCAVLATSHALSVNYVTPPDWWKKQCNVECSDIKETGYIGWGNLFFNTMASLQYFSFTTAPLYHVMSASTRGTPNTAQSPVLKSRPHGKNMVQENVMIGVYQMNVLRIVKWLQSGDQPRLHHHLQSNAMLNALISKRRDILGEANFL